MPTRYQAGESPISVADNELRAQTSTSAGWTTQISSSVTGTQARTVAVRLRMLARMIATRCSAEARATMPGPSVGHCSEQTTDVAAPMPWPSTTLVQPG
jgi:hypothetical protein